MKQQIFTQTVMLITSFVMTFFNQVIKWNKSILLFYSQMILKHLDASVFFKIKNKYIIVCVEVIIYFNSSISFSSSSFHPSPFSSALVIEPSSRFFLSVPGTLFHGKIRIPLLSGFSLVCWWFVDFLSNATIFTCWHCIDNGYLIQKLFKRFLYAVVSILNHIDFAQTGVNAIFGITDSD